MKPSLLAIAKCQACLMAFLFTLGNDSSHALPPPEDIPEEIMRTEIILEARSPIDGVALNPAEYAELQAQLQESNFDPKLNSDVQELIFLLQLRKFIRTFTGITINP
ncbi:hypothetical protein Xen7305DRAFT_00037330 [Xenococcus sp. PCC 7305]|uniref:hypothetical protein n=1 Tax=Xenococcus sp. PCC 7305 TaxID=102125 RepID=UPI0002ACD62C|nr:hypothetical protein [Xenococcus sp. PCC 7305]ELS04005.1 hypothetical protein Xen7305DRAFT_00037330 [Xenococcus sp. PCC 7305]